MLFRSHALLWNTEDTTPYECDGLTAYRERPMVVALPETYDELRAVLKTCYALEVPVVARGAGTGLSGGAMPHRLGVTLSLAKFNKILKLDPASRTAVVQGGVRNLAISDAALQAERSARCTRQAEVVAALRAVLPAHAENLGCGPSTRYGAMAV